MIFNPGFNIEPTTNPMGFVYGADKKLYIPMGIKALKFL